MVMMIYFTGHEKESDLAEGIYTTEYRLYDARVGRWLSVDPLFEKYVGMSPYNYCMLNPVMMVDPDGRDWILAQGNKTIWYAGKYGDRSEILHEYKSTSGYANEFYGEDFRNSKYQHIPNLGPTVEGKYQLKLGDGSIKKAKTHKGALIRANDGIESLTEIDSVDNDAILQSWGEKRIRMQKVDVKQPVDNESGEISERDLDSFYFHDSKKGHTSGCHEIESQFFDDLQEHSKKGNKKIEVKVEYKANQSTYGGTDL